MCCELMSLVGVPSVFGLDGTSGMEGGYCLLVTLVGLASVCDMMDRTYLKSLQVGWVECNVRGLISNVFNWDLWKVLWFHVIGGRALCIRFGWRGFLLSLQFG